MTIIFFSLLTQSSKNKDECLHVHTLMPVCVCDGAPTDITISHPSDTHQRYHASDRIQVSTATLF